MFWHFRGIYCLHLQGEWINWRWCYSDMEEEMCWLYRVHVLQITATEGSLHDVFRENSLSHSPWVEYGNPPSKSWDKEDSGSPQINSLAIMRLQIPSILTSTVHSVLLFVHPNTNHAKLSIAGRDQTSVLAVCCTQINLSIKYIMQIYSCYFTFCHFSTSGSLMFSGNLGETPGHC